MSGRRVSLGSGETWALSAFRAFTFDCYGTLVDWDGGVLRALRTWPALDADDGALLAAFRRYENPLKTRRPALPYPEVLRRTFDAIARDFGHAAADGDADAFAASIADWPPFADSVDALAYLRERAALIVLSNVDRASLAHSARRLGHPFDEVVTAEDVGSYKPSPPHFERALALLAERDIAPGQVLHVGQSLHHDMQPARAIGFATCWINRRGLPPPAADEAPDMTFDDMAGLVARHRAETGQPASLATDSTPTADRETRG